MVSIKTDKTPKNQGWNQECFQVILTTYYVTLNKQYIILVIIQQWNGLTGCQNMLSLPDMLPFTSSVVTLLLCMTPLLKESLRLHCSINQRSWKTLPLLTMTLCLFLLLFWSLEGCFGVMVSKVKA